MDRRDFNWVVAGSALGFFPFSPISPAETVDMMSLFRDDLKGEIPNGYTVHSFEGHPDGFANYGIVESIILTNQNRKDYGSFSRWRACGRTIERSEEIIRIKQRSAAWHIFDKASFYIGHGSRQNLQRQMIERIGPCYFFKCGEVLYGIRKNAQLIGWSGLSSIQYHTDKIGDYVEVEHISTFRAVNDVGARGLII
jgi:hypothetical protein